MASSVKPKSRSLQDRKAREREGMTIEYPARLYRLSLLGDLKGDPLYPFRFLRKGEVMRYYDYKSKQYDSIRQMCSRLRRYSVAEGGDFFVQCKQKRSDLGRFIEVRRVS